MIDTHMLGNDAMVATGHGHDILSL